jgi:PAS domain S-box-containing protein
MRKDKPSPLAENVSDYVRIDRLEAAFSALKDRALDASAEGISIADATKPDQPLIYVNDGFEKLTGYSSDEALGRNCRFLQGGGTDPATIDVIRHAVEDARECVVEILNYHKDGTPFWNRLSVTPITDNEGVVTHFIGVQSDITDLKDAQDALREANEKLERANRRIGDDLEMAARIQNGFLPEKSLDIDGLDVAWELRSCDELAGDTLNVIPLDDRRIELYTIDVSGHGVPAALLSVTLNHFLSPPVNRTVLPDDATLSPSGMASKLNRQFPFDNERAQFFTAVYGIYDTVDRTFQFVSAGHPPPVYVPRAGKPHLEWTEGLPIGIAPGFQYEENTLRLERGDRVYLFSDGLIDVVDSRDEPFGMERLESLLADFRDIPLQSSVDRVIEAVEAWGGGAPFEDDVSILAFEAR